MSRNKEAGASQHRFDAGPIGYPPIRRVARIAMFDEMQFGIAWRIEHLRLPEIVVLGGAVHLGAAPLHRLKNEKVARRMLMDEIKRKQGMTQMIENAHKKHDVKALA